jgi:pimeloyl-ACP methyl ester carboxylesterase
MSGHFIDIEPGVELYYEEAGSGQPLVLVPGWTFTTEVFSHQIAHFSKTHRVIALDPRSQGRSSLSLHGNHYGQHGADLAKVFRALELKEAVLVGWSFGCLGNWAYVKQEGLAALKGMVCIDLSPKPLSTADGDWVEGPLGEIGGLYNDLLQSPQGQRDFVTAYAKDIMVQRPLSDDELFWLTGQSLKTPYYVAAALFASGMFADYLAVAQQVDAGLPALAVIAEHWSGTAVPFMNRHCPNTRTAVLGGHLMFWEHPDAFNTLLGDFLATL